MNEKKKPRKAKPAKANGKHNGDCPTSTALVKTTGRKPRVPYSEELAEKIFERLRNGETVRAICRSPGMPSRPALVRQWAHEDPVFGEKYQRARELGCHAMADEILDLSDNASTDSGAVSRDRLRVDSRRWLLARILPSIYGDRVEAQIKGGLVVVQLDAKDMAL
jgi:hypothetical protein